MKPWPFGYFLSGDLVMGFDRSVNAKWNAGGEE
jgi:hypothetical protein